MKPFKQMSKVEKDVLINSICDNIEGSFPKDTIFLLIAMQEGGGDICMKGNLISSQITHALRELANLFEERQSYENN